MGMGKLFVVNASVITQKIKWRLPNGRVTALVIGPGAQEEVDAAFDEADRVALINHIETYGGLDISETSQTPPGFSGLAYRWERPASESEITRAHEVDMTRRQKISAREMLNGVKAFDGTMRNIRGLPTGAMVSETTILETAPAGETPPSGGLKSTIIGDVHGGRVDI